METVYSEFKTYGSSPILKTKPRIVPNGKPFNYEVVPFDINKTDISQEDQRTIRQYFEQLNKFDPFELVEKTHSESLWYEYQDEIMTYSAPKYSNSEIRKYFSENTSEQIWKK